MDGEQGQLEAVGDADLVVDVAQGSVSHKRWRSTRTTTVTTQFGVIWMTGSAHDTLFFLIVYL